MSQAVPLIDKEDGFQIVRDKLAEILATETVAQQALAVIAGQDPDLYKFRVYLERINPWEEFVTSSGDVSPIVNVWYDSGTFDPSASNQSTRQKAASQFHLDIYAYAESEETVGGHIPGDKAAALLAQNIVKLARNILMHDKYKYLELRGDVWKRWVSNITAFQPQSENQPVQQIAACRIVLTVDHNEEISLEDHETLEITHINIRHEPGGMVIAELQYGP